MIISREQLADLPAFTEWFNETQVRTDVNEYVNKFYDDQMTDYMKDKETAEKRTIEDWQDFLKDITPEKEDQLTDVQQQFRNALNSATEAYGARGLAFSSIRQEGETQLRSQLEKSQAGIERTFTQKQRESEKIKTRTLEDIARKTERTKKQVKREKVLTAEQRLAQKESEALTKYGLATQGVLKKEDLGISA